MNYREEASSEFRAVFSGSSLQYPRCQKQVELRIEDGSGCEFAQDFDSYQNVKLGKPEILNAIPESNGFKIVLSVPVNLICFLNPLPVTTEVTFASKLDEFKKVKTFDHLIRDPELNVSVKDLLPFANYNVVIRQRSGKYWSDSLSLRIKTLMSGRTIYSSINF